MHPGLQRIFFTHRVPPPYHVTLAEDLYVRPSFTQDRNLPPTHVHSVLYRPAYLHVQCFYHPAAFLHQDEFF